MKEREFIDIHCHSVMTHYRNPEIKKSAGEEIESKVIGFIDTLFGKETMRSYVTQSDFGKLAHGNVKAVMISFYPIERKWYLPKTNAPIVKDALISSITGFSRQNLVKLMKEKEANYFADLVNEYKYLLSQVDKKYSGKKFKIATNYTEYAKNAQSGDTVSVIISIEGGHSLGSLSIPDLDKKPEFVMVEDYYQKFRKNVYKLKKWGPNSDGTHTPLYITLSHHFWNMLAGHCESLMFIFNQSIGKETGLTDAGREMIEDLLSDENEEGVPNKSRRVLIDVKHMSPLARKQFYLFLAKRKKNTGLNIPIICSHASIGDAPELNCFIKGTEEEKKFKTPNNYFNTTTLSLNDEDIKEIVDSDGLIGIILHEKRIAGKNALKKEPYKVNQKRKIMDELQNEIERLQFELQNTQDLKRKNQLVGQISRNNSKRLLRMKEIMEAYICMIMANIYRIVEVSGEKGWDHVCLGSDFDGTINKLDFLGTSEKLPMLTEMMLAFMNNPQDLDKFNKKWTKKYLKTLHFGAKPEILIDKFSNKNVDAFLKKYFTEDYLVKGVNPV
ncbi:MAG TPA: membrane dipeptidase [Bacteroidales bacterium]